MHRPSLNRASPDNRSPLTARTHRSMDASVLEPEAVRLSAAVATVVRRRLLMCRLAMMALERLLILQPHNWALRRDYGMMLYYNREYEAAVQELSICMAFAPEDEEVVLESFVEKLHLMRIETSWTKSIRLASSSFS